MYCPITSIIIDGLDEYELDPSLSCNCTSMCNENCGCFKRYGFVYDKHEKILFTQDDTKLNFECNDNCKCSINCINRVVQRGSKIKISVRHSKNKGFGVFAEEDIEEREFLGIYVGVVVDENTEGPYVFQIRENTPSRTFYTTLDAEYYGNFTRFINHSCSPNLAPFIVRINHIIPTIAFYSLKKIQKGKELTFEYRKHSNEQICFCRSKKCKGSF